MVIPGAATIHRALPDGTLPFLFLESISFELEELGHVHAMHRLFMMFVIENIRHQRFRGHDRCEGLKRQTPKELNVRNFPMIDKQFALVELEF